MTFIVQTQINIVFNDGQSEFDGFEPLTVGLTLWVDLNFRDQMLHQLFAFKGIHNIVKLFKADENLVNVVAGNFIRFDSLLLCTGIHQIVFGFLDFIVHLVKPLVKVRFADDVVAVIRIKCVNLLHDFGFDGVILPQLLFSGSNFLFNVMEKESQTIFDKNVIEFVTVAAEFCAFLERAERMKRSTFVDTSLKILPLLYLKASMLPKCETIGDEALETYVTEEIYEILRINLSGLMADKDDYLDVFVQDMVYSDQPIKKSISEDLADIYQDIKDFIFVFQLGLNETMNDSLAICQENFGTLWGQKLVNTLRALHDVKYNQEEEEVGNEEGFYEPSDDNDCCEEDGCHCHDDDCHCHEDGCHCHDDELK